MHPQQRPTLEQVMAHPFLDPKANLVEVRHVEEAEYAVLPRTEIPVSVIDQQPLAPVKARSVARMAYHFFVSHNQCEVYICRWLPCLFARANAWTGVLHPWLQASGDVGTLFALLGLLGLHGWRDVRMSLCVHVYMRACTHTCLYA